jgi:asparagine synthase (glutamine-hydrolysing)
MCGIAGVVAEREKSPPERPRLVEMAARLRHRGPDGDGVYIDAHAALVHTRLSIIDIEGGRQPLSNEDGTVWTVFNGEIYNFAELRERLQARGHRFQTNCDTEVIVHLYEDEGDECIKQLRGMFALAIWDCRRQRLLLARDRLGKKPLVYTVQGGMLAFASELNALMAVPGVPRELNPAAVDQYFSLGYIPHPQTIYRDVFKLPPAHFAVFEEGQLLLERYWSFGNEPQLAAQSEAEICEQVRAELTEATRLRLVSDVPLGAFLSGGVDSSIVVALMQQLSSQPVKTFSIRFAESEYDESGHAKLVAKHLGTEHHEFLVEENSFDVLPALVWHFGEPFGDASALPTWFVSKLTRQAVTVALTGDGGDEVFCGYDRYKVLQRLAQFDLLPTRARQLAGSAAVRRMLPGEHSSRLARRAHTFLRLLALSPRERLSRIAAVIFSEASKSNLYNADFAWIARDKEPLSFLEYAGDHVTEREFIAHATLVDQLTYLPGDILTKVDIASMAHGLECRSPLLDQNVVALAARIPLSLKLRGNCGKYILKRAFADMIPQEILRRRKQGFVVPIARWFRGELKDYLREVLLDPSTLGRGYFQVSAVQQLIDEHLTGVQDHSRRLWALLCFELWHRQVFDSSRCEPVAA